MTSGIFVLLTLAIVTVMGMAAFSDARTRRIPNAITVGGVLVAIGLRALPGDPTLVAGLAAAAIGFLMGFPLFALGGFGGGDAKLLVTAGAFLGPRGFGLALLFVGVVGGFLAVWMMVRRRVAIPAFYSTKDALAYLVTLGRRGSWPTAERPGALTVPYGIAIAIGSVAAWFSPLMERLQ